MDLIYSAYNNLVDYLYSLLLSLGVILKDISIWLMVELMSVSRVLLDGFSGVFESLDLTQYLTALPSDVTNVMGLCGIGNCTSIIVSCLLVRLLMQLIPFVRLGS